ncbi:FRG domain-containing protein [Pseudomonas syringae]
MEYVEEYKFRTAQEFLAALTPWSGVVNLEHFIFRGHSDANYSLIPSAIRPEAKEKIWDYSSAFAKIEGSTSDNDFSQAFVEYQLIRDFYRGADARGLNVPVSERLRKRLHQKVDFATMTKWIDGDKWLPSDMLEVAALAQHYGVHTRLLDWTYDPFVAAFFASQPPGKPDRDLCIWGLNASEIGVLDAGEKDMPLTLVTPHYSDNPNLAAQSGLFTHWAYTVPGLDSIVSGKTEILPLVDRRPLDELLKQYVSTLTSYEAGTLFVKLILPGSESLDLARLLRKLGYGPARIFPGYGGVALELQERPFLKKSNRQVN